MGDVKEFPLVPDPSGDRQVWECELTMLERCEGLYEGLADRDRMVVYLAESILQRTPLDPDPTREMLNIGEHDLVNITDALAPCDGKRRCSSS